MGTERGNSLKLCQGGKFGKNPSWKRQPGSGGFGVATPGNVQGIPKHFLGDQVGIRHRLGLMILEGFSSLSDPGIPGFKALPSLPHSEL